MDIGKESEPYVIEPMEEPVPRTRREAPPEPKYEPVPEREPELVPA
jgi:hypothetical protein